MPFDFSKFNTIKALVIGDLMIDEYLWGDVDRISPEAPVQVVSVKKEDYTLGGAGNVVNNMVALGAKVSVAGVIGTKADGQRMIDLFKNMNVDTQAVVFDPQRPTTRKTRVIAANQHVVRIDRETKQEIADQTFSSLLNLIEQKIPDANVVIVSDYGKGVITPSLLEKVFSLCRKLNIFTIVDPKGLSFAKYQGAGIITPNKKEASLVAGIDLTDQDQVLMAGQKILDQVNIDSLLITCGKDGMVLFERQKQPFVIKADAKQVYDVSGAGDTVVAVMGLCAAAGASLKDAATLANTAAGIVVGKVGTATISQKELNLALLKQPDSSLTKHKTISELKVISAELKKKGKKIVMTNGCFDILHPGHIQLFSESKQMGDVLVLAIDDDDSVKAIKGQGRPIIKAEERVRILSALDSVDYVTIFASHHLDQILTDIAPDILTKGSNYSTSEVKGGKIVEGSGGRVALIPIRGDISTSQIIKDIQNTKKC